MRYWLDTEFIDDGRTIDLISIGIVSEDGRELYAESTECDLSRANDWVRRKVLPHIGHDQNPDALRVGRQELAARVLEFCDLERYGKPEFWGYHAGYDWVVLCQLFGTMMHLPKGWPRYAYDLRQWLDHKGFGNVTQPDDAPHHALSDARWIAETHKAMSAG